MRCALPTRHAMQLDWHAAEAKINALAATELDPALVTPDELDFARDLDMHGVFPTLHVAACQPRKGMTHLQHEGFGGREDAESDDLLLFPALYMGDYPHALGEADASEIVARYIASLTEFVDPPRCTAPRSVHEKYLSFDTTRFADDCMDPSADSGARLLAEASGRLDASCEEVVSAPFIQTWVMTWHTMVRKPGTTELVAFPCFNIRRIGWGVGFRRKGLFRRLIQLLTDCGKAKGFAGIQIESPCGWRIRLAAQSCGFAEEYNGNYVLRFE